MKKLISELEIRMSNALVEARYEYSEIQLDILFYVMACLRKDKDDRAVLNYELDVAELENLRQKKIHTSRLQEIIEGMGNKPLSVRTPDMTDPDDFYSVWLFQGAKYLKGKKVLKVRLSELIVPYLFDLSKSFTSIQLQSILLMTSKYAKRIYQICAQWKNSRNGESKIFEIDNFKEMIGIDSNEYKQIGQLKTSVLQIAVKQINQYSDLKVSYEFIKKGRAFVQIKFTIEDQKAPQIPIDYRYNEKQARAKIQLEKLGIVDEKLLGQILTQHLDGFNKWLYDYQTGKFKVATSPAGHLLKTLGLVTSKPSTKAVK